MNTKYDNHYSNSGWNHNHCLDPKKYPLCYKNRWSEIPYPGQTDPYKGIEPLAGSWTSTYVNLMSSGRFYTPDNKPIYLNLLDPSQINFSKDLKEVEYVQANLTQTQKNIASYWGGVPIFQWDPICLELLKTYKVDPPMCGRILYCLHCALNDAFVVTWHYKYLFDRARPCQLNRDLKTFLPTPIFPTYPSGHSVVSGAAQIVLSYFFPAESSKLSILAQTASISRLFGGIHFKSDLDEGLKLGRQIGKICTEYMQKDFDFCGQPIDVPFTKYENAPIMPDYK